jgi:Domain of unknown function (DUF1929)
MADKWELAGNSEVLAVHAALLPSGEVLYFSGSEHTEGATSVDAARLWSPMSGTVIPVGSPQVDLFCCGHCLLTDGNVLVAGGTAFDGTAPYEAGAPEPHKDIHFIGIVSTHIFNWRDKTWRKVADMAGGRWYPTCVTLPDGKVLTISGHNAGGQGHENTTLESFDPATNTWSSAFRTTPALEDTGVFYMVSGPIAGAVGGAAAGAVGGLIAFPIGPIVGAGVGAVVGAATQPRIGQVNPMIYYPRLHLLPNRQIFSSTALQVEGLRKTRTIGLPVTTQDPATGASTTTSVLTELAGPPFEQPRPYSHHGGGRYMENVYARSAFPSVLLPLRPPGYGARILICGEKQPKLFEPNNPHLGWQDAGAPRPYEMRAYANAVLLPDATVLVLGGAESERIPDPKVTNLFNRESWVGGYDRDAVPFAERYHPGTNSWETLSAPDTQPTAALRRAPIARVYHSVALLLPDARVWIAGSNHDGSRNVVRDGAIANKDDPSKGDARELRMEIYSPPYLFARDAAGNDILDGAGDPVPAARPEIRWARAGCAYGQRFEIHTADPDESGTGIVAGIPANQVSRVALIRCSTVTHAFNPDQRYVELVIDHSRTTIHSLTVTGPPAAEIAPPGYYLLFALNAVGTPSVARLFQLSANYPVIERVETRSDTPTLRYDFGVVELGLTKEVSFQFRNVGAGELQVRDPNFSEGDFRVETMPGSPDFGIPPKLKNAELTLSPDAANPGRAAQLKVAFTPKHYGQYAGALTLFTNAPDAPIFTISLTARVLGLQLEITPAAPRGAALDFGEVPVGGSGTLAITVRNIGGVDATISDMIVSDAEPNQQFHVAFVIPDRVVPVNQARTFDVAYLPTFVGQAQAYITLIAESSSFEYSFRQNHLIELAGQGSGPSVSLAPARLTFATQLVRTVSAPQTVTLRNIGTAPLTITAITTTSEFDQTSICPANLAAGQSCSIAVRFRPAGGGPRAGVLTVESDAVGSPHSIALAGDGLVEPIATLSPGILNFGDQPVGTGGAVQTVRLTNDGATNLRVFGVAVAGINASDFVVAADRCTGNILPPEGACEASVRFNPTAAGSRSAVLEFSTDAGGSPHRAALSGIGTMPLAISLNPTSMTFVDQPVGSRSVAQTVVLTNNGAAPLTVDEVQLTGPDVGDFQVTTDTCRGASIASGASCVVSLAFSPTVVGRRSAGLRFIHSRPGGPQTLPLEGVGTGPGLSWDPATLAFPPQTVGTFSQAQEVTLRNVGNAVLAISSITVTGDFRHGVMGNTGLPPGGFCVVRVVCSPTAVGERSGALTIISNAAGSPHQIPLSGEGTTPFATVSPASLAFGNQLVSTTGAAQIVTLTNSGGTMVEITGVSLIGTNPGDFVTGANSCAASSIQPGNSCSVEVRFTPTAIGGRRAELLFTTNRGPLIVPLTGNGL